MPKRWISWAVYTLTCCWVVNCDYIATLSWAELGNCIKCLEFQCSILKRRYWAVKWKAEWKHFIEKKIGKAEYQKYKYLMQSLHICRWPWSRHKVTSSYKILTIQLLPSDYKNVVGCGRWLVITKWLLVGCWRPNVL